jgi:hypothetical protein
VVVSGSDRRPENHLVGWMKSRLDHMERVLGAQEWLAGGNSQLQTC